MRIGVDVDGVLADFNSSFIQRCIDVTGKDLFPPRPFDIPTWHYPQVYGYTEEEMDYRNGPVWRSVHRDPYFWFDLKPYPTTKDDLEFLTFHANRIADVYFITNRDGVRVKSQTEGWLRKYDCTYPTVLISAAKGLCAQALKLDLYIDDRHENCVDVITRNPSTRVFVMDRPWNRTEQMLEEQKGLGILRVSCVREIF